ncbi:hypothetical protein JYK22_31365 [Nonomuraea sp. RK-328]|nr:hypothetical protein [Nonomuraea sp. RK-328]
MPTADNTQLRPRVRKLLRKFPVSGPEFFEHVLRLDRMAALYQRTPVFLLRQRHLDYTDALVSTAAAIYDASTYHPFTGDDLRRIKSLVDLLAGQDRRLPTPQVFLRQVAEAMDQHPEMADVEGLTRFVEWYQATRGQRFPGEQGVPALRRAAAELFGDVESTEAVVKVAMLFEAAAQSSTQIALGPAGKRWTFVAEKIAEALASGTRWNRDLVKVVEDALTDARADDTGNSGERAPESAPDRSADPGPRHAQRDRQELTPAQGGREHAPARGGRELAVRPIPDVLAAAGRQAALSDLTVAEARAAFDAEVRPSDFGSRSMTWSWVDDTTLLIGGRHIRFEVGPTDGDQPALTRLGAGTAQDPHVARLAPRIAPNQAAIAVLTVASDVVQALTAPRTTLAALTGHPDGRDTSHNARQNIFRLLSRGFRSAETAEARAALRARLDAILSSFTEGVSTEAGGQRLERLRALAEPPRTAAAPTPAPAPAAPEPARPRSTDLDPDTRPALLPVHDSRILALLKDGDNDAFAIEPRKAMRASQWAHLRGDAEVREVTERPQEARNRSLLEVRLFDVVDANGVIHPITELTLLVRYAAHPNLTEAELLQEKSNALDAVDLYYNHQHRLRDGSQLHLRLEFVADREGQPAVTFHPRTLRCQPDWVNIYAGWGLSLYAHELGHHLGFADEYVEESVWGRRTLTDAQVTRDPSLMGSTMLFWAVTGQLVYDDEGVPFPAHVGLRLRHLDALADLAYGGRQPSIAKGAAGPAVPYETTTFHKPTEDNAQLSDNMRLLLEKFPSRGREFFDHVLRLNRMEALHGSTVAVADQGLRHLDYTDALTSTASVLYATRLEFPFAARELDRVRHLTEFLTEPAGSVPRPHHIVGRVADALGDPTGFLVREMDGLARFATWLHASGRRRLPGEDGVQALRRAASELFDDMSGTEALRKAVRLFTGGAQISEQIAWGSTRVLAKISEVVAARAPGEVLTGYDLATGVAAAMSAAASRDGEAGQPRDAQTSRQMTALGSETEIDPVTGTPVRGAATQVGRAGLPDGAVAFHHDPNGPAPVVRQPQHAPTQGGRKIPVRIVGGALAADRRQADLDDLTVAEARAAFDARVRPSDFGNRSVSWSWTDETTLLMDGQHIRFEVGPIDAGAPALTRLGSGTAQDPHLATLAPHIAPDRAALAVLAVTSDILQALTAPSTTLAALTGHPDGRDTSHNARLNVFRLLSREFRSAETSETRTALRAQLDAILASFTEGVSAEAGGHRLERLRALAEPPTPPAPAPAPAPLVREPARPRSTDLNPDTRPALLPLHDDRTLEALRDRPADGSRRGNAYAIEPRQAVRASQWARLRQYPGEEVKERHPWSRSRSRLEVRSLRVVDEAGVTHPVTEFTLILRFAAHPDMSQAELLAEQSNLLDAVDVYYNHQHRLRDGSQLHLRVRFVEAQGDEPRVTFHPRTPGARPDAESLYAGWGLALAAHELGHHLDFDDDYMEAAKRDRRTLAGVLVHRDPTFMGSERLWWSEDSVSDLHGSPFPARVGMRERHLMKLSDLAETMEVPARRRPRALDVFSPPTERRPRELPVVVGPAEPAVPYETMRFVMPTADNTRLPEHVRQLLAKFPGHGREFFDHVLRLERMAATHREVAIPDLTRDHLTFTDALISTAAAMYGTSIEFPFRGADLRRIRLLVELVADQDGAVPRPHAFLRQVAQAMGRDRITVGDVDGLARFAEWFRFTGGRRFPGEQGVRVLRRAAGELFGDRASTEAVVKTAHLFAAAADNSENIALGHVGDRFAEVAEKIVEVLAGRAPGEFISGYDLAQAVEEALGSASTDGDTRGQAQAADRSGSAGEITRPAGRPGPAPGGTASTPETPIDPLTGTPTHGSARRDGIAGLPDGGVAFYNDPNAPNPRGWEAGDESLRRGRQVAAEMGWTGLPDVRLRQLGQIDTLYDATARDRQAAMRRAEWELGGRRGVYEAALELLNTGLPQIREALSAQDHGRFSATLLDHATSTDLLLRKGRALTGQAAMHSLSEAELRAIGQFGLWAGLRADGAADPVVDRLVRGRRLLATLWAFLQLERMGAWVALNLMNGSADRLEQYMGLHESHRTAWVGKRIGGTAYPREARLDLGRLAEIGGPELFGGRLAPGTPTPLSALAASRPLHQLIDVYLTAIQDRFGPILNATTPDQLADALRQAEQAQQDDPAVLRGREVAAEMGWTGLPNLRLRRLGQVAALYSSRSGFPALQEAQHWLGGQRGVYETARQTLDAGDARVMEALDTGNHDLLTQALVDHAAATDLLLGRGRALAREAGLDGLSTQELRAIGKFGMWAGLKADRAADPDIQQLVRQPGLRATLEAFLDLERKGAYAALDLMNQPADRLRQYMALTGDDRLRWLGEAVSRLNNAPSETWLALGRLAEIGGPELFGGRLAPTRPSTPLSALAAARELSWLVKVYLTAVRDGFRPVIDAATPDQLADALNQAETRREATGTARPEETAGRQGAQEKPSPRSGPAQGLVRIATAYDIERLLSGGRRVTEWLGGELGLARELIEPLLWEAHHREQLVWEPQQGQVGRFTKEVARDLLKGVIAQDPDRWLGTDNAQKADSDKNADDTANTNSDENADGTEDAGSTDTAENVDEVVSEPPLPETGHTQVAERMPRTSPATRQDVHEWLLVKVYEKLKRELQDLQVAAAELIRRHAPAFGTRPEGVVMLRAFTAGHDAEINEAVRQGLRSEPLAGAVAEMWAAWQDLPPLAAPVSYWVDLTPQELADRVAEPDAVLSEFTLVTAEAAPPASAVPEGKVRVRFDFDVAGARELGPITHQAGARQVMAAPGTTLRVTYVAAEQRVVLSDGPAAPPAALTPAAPPPASAPPATGHPAAPAGTRFATSTRIGDGTWEAGDGWVAYAEAHGHTLGLYRRLATRTIHDLHLVGDVLHVLQGDGWHRVEHGPRLRRLRQADLTPEMADKAARLRANPAGYFPIMNGFNQTIREEPGQVSLRHGTAGIIVTMSIGHILDVHVPVSGESLAKLLTSATAMGTVTHPATGRGGVRVGNGWMEFTVLEDGSVVDAVVRTVDITPELVGLELTQVVSEPTGFTVGGINDEATLARLEEFGGVPRTEIEQRLRAAGLLGRTEDVRDGLVRDNTWVLTGELTHHDVAQPLRLIAHVLRHVDQARVRLGGHEYDVRVLSRSGPADNPFGGATPDTSIEVVNVATGERLTFDAVIAEAAASHGFYGGRRSPARVSPEQIVGVFTHLNERMPDGRPAELTRYADRDLESPAGEVAVVAVHTVPGARAPELPALPEAVAAPPPGLTPMAGRFAGDDDVLVESGDSGIRYYARLDDKSGIARIGVDPRSADEATITVEYDTRKVARWSVGTRGTASLHTESHAKYAVSRPTEKQLSQFGFTLVAEDGRQRIMRFTHGATTVIAVLDGKRRLTGLYRSIPFSPAQQRLVDAATLQGDTRNREPVLEVNGLSFAVRLKEDHYSGPGVPFATDLCNTDWSSSYGGAVFAELPPASSGVAHHQVPDEAARIAQSLRRLTASPADLSGFGQLGATPFWRGGPFVLLQLGDSSVVLYRQVTDATAQPEELHVAHDDGDGVRIRSDAEATTVAITADGQAETLYRIAAPRGAHLLGGSTEGVRLGDTWLEWTVHPNDAHVRHLVVHADPATIHAMLDAASPGRLDDVRTLEKQLPHQVMEGWRGDVAGVVRHDEHLVQIEGSTHAELAMPLRLIRVLDDLMPGFDRITIGGQEYEVRREMPLFPVRSPFGDMLDYSPDYVLVHKASRKELRFPGRAGELIAAHGFYGDNIHMPRVDPQDIKVFFSSVLSSDAGISGLLPGTTTGAAARHPGGGGWLGTSPYWRGVSRLVKRTGTGDPVLYLKREPRHYRGVRIVDVDATAEGGPELLVGFNEDDMHALPMGDVRLPGGSPRQRRRYPYGRWEQPLREQLEESGFHPIHDDGDVRILRYAWSGGEMLAVFVGEKLDGFFSREENDETGQDVPAAQAAESDGTTRLASDSHTGTARRSPETTAYAPENPIDPLTGTPVRGSARHTGFAGMPEGTVAFHHDPNRPNAGGWPDNGGTTAANAPQVSPGHDETTNRIDQLINAPGEGRGSHRVDPPPAVSDEELLAEGERLMGELVVLDASEPTVRALALMGRSVGGPEPKWAIQEMARDLGLSYDIDALVELYNDAQRYGMAPDTATDRTALTEILSRCMDADTYRWTGYRQQTLFSFLEATATQARTIGLMVQMMGNPHTQSRARDFIRPVLVRHGISTVKDALPVIWAAHQNGYFPVGTTGAAALGEAMDRFRQEDPYLWNGVLLAEEHALADRGDDTVRLLAALDDIVTQPGAAMGGVSSLERLAGHVGQGGSIEQLVRLAEDAQARGVDLAHAEHAQQLVDLLTSHRAQDRHLWDGLRIAAEHDIKQPSDDDARVLSRLTEITGSKAPSRMWVFHPLRGLAREAGLDHSVELLVRRAVEVQRSGLDLFGPVDRRQLVDALSSHVRGSAGHRLPGPQNAPSGVHDLSPSAVRDALQSAVHEHAQAEQAYRQANSRLSRAVRRFTGASAQAFAEEERVASLEARVQAWQRWPQAPEVSFTRDFAAFADAYDRAVRRATRGDAVIPYMLENATASVGAREGGRGFGLEIEFDVPGRIAPEGRKAIAHDLYAAGLTADPAVHSYHASHDQGYRSGRDGGRGLWVLERDGSVDGELVSPILYDEPATWENLRIACEIIRSHGGRATVRTGGHVHVSTHDYDHIVDNYTSVLNYLGHHIDTLFRLGHNPEAGSHRGLKHCHPNPLPSAGYTEIGTVRNLHSSHEFAMNMYGMNGSAKDHIEFRLWDGSLDPAVIQARVKLSLALVEAAFRNASLGDLPNGGRHDALGTHAALLAQEPGLDLTEQGTLSFRRLMDELFWRAADKEQVTALFAATRWGSAV